MDDTSPSTKADFIGLMERIGDTEIRMERWKNEITEDMDSKIQVVTEELKEYMDKKTEETKHYFYVVAENLKHDLWGIHNDKISVLDDRSNDHEQRIVVMEKQLAV